MAKTVDADQRSPTLDQLSCERSRSSGDADLLLQYQSDELIQEMRTLITILMFVHPDGPARSRILVRKYKEECGGDEAID